jgi:hypothetical protein
LNIYIQKKYKKIYKTERKEDGKRRDKNKIISASKQP